MTRFYPPVVSGTPGNASLGDAGLGLAAMNPDVQERRLRRVLELIQSEPSRSVRELALEVRLSPAHLQRLFKQKTGVLIGWLVVENRLQKAAQMLSASNLSIKEIAHAVGYKHHSSFVRAFQRRFALAPGNYRNGAIFSSTNLNIKQG